MEDAKLIEELNYLGIDQESHRVIALLPLIQVGWADGRIQPAEREIIMEVAHQRGLVTGDGARVLEGWLEHPPTHAYQERGRAVLFQLARRGGGLGQDLRLETIEEMLDLCQKVARAAGGLFGLIGRVEPSEKEVLAQIAQALDVARELSQGESYHIFPAQETWQDLEQELE